MIQQAHENGLTLGKYRVNLELLKYDLSVTAEDCQGMTMRELHAMIDEHTGETSNNAEEQPRGYGHGKNHGNGKKHHQ